MKKNVKSLIMSNAIWVGLVVVVIVGGLYFTTNIFKTNQQLFCERLDTIKIADENLTDKYNYFNDVIKKESNSSNLNVTALKSTANKETQVSDIQEMFTMNSKGLKNTLLNQSYRDWVFSKDNQTFLKLKTLKDNNDYGIIADNILGKFFVVENSELRDLFSKLGITNTNIIPDSLINNYQEVFEPYDSITELKERYLNLIYKTISKEKYYKISNEDKTITLGMVLSEQETFDILKLILDTMKNDNQLLETIESKLKNLNYNNVNAENIQSAIQECIDRINNNTYSSDGDYFKISLLTKEEKVLNVDIEIKYIKNNEDNTLNNEYKKNLKLNLETENQLFFEIIDNNQKKLGIILNWNYDNEKMNISTEIELWENEEKKIFKLQHQISDYQTKNIKQVTVINVILSDLKYQIEINNNITLKEDVQISKLTTENSVKINQMTAGELKQIKDALINRINELYNVDLQEVYNKIIKE